MDKYLDKPLSNAEYDRLDQILSKLDGDDAMGNLEVVDGFFAALLCSPSLVPPSEYLPEIWGEELSEQPGLRSLEQVEELVSLLTRHWNGMARRLAAGEVFVPLVELNERGVYGGHDWAWGFLRGADMRREEWSVIFDSEGDAAAMTPVFMLAHEFDTDPEMRPPPIPDEKREELILFLSRGVSAIFAFFQARRRQTSPAARRRAGRNEPCPCASGRKYKKGCGVHDGAVGSFTSLKAILPVSFLRESLLRAKI